MTKKKKKEPAKKTEDLGGRPRMFETAEALQEEIDEYFKSGIREKEVLLKTGEKVKVPVPTISGLCYYLGFESRQSFYDYEKEEGFSYTVKRARLFIELEYEAQLQVGNTTGAIFALKNMGWIDKTQTDITLDGDSISPIQWVKNGKDK
jgi:hypothetical protein